ncbi:MAG: polyketide synthase dehydratase domain-containing protein, partial [Caldilinea sp.]
SLGALYVRGAQIDWEGFDWGYSRRKVALPTYPFQRQRCWVEPARQLRMAVALRPLVDRSMELPSHQETIFEKTFSTETLPFLADHHVYGEIVVPGACHLSLALSCAELFYQNGPCQVEDVIFPQALVLTAGTERRVQLIVEGEPSNVQHAFEILSVDRGEDAVGERQLHATGRLTRSVPAAPEVDLSALRVRCSAERSVSIFFDRLADAQIVLGSTFRWITEVWTNGQKEALARLQKPQSVPALAGYPLFPSLIDSCFQLVSEMADMMFSAETALPFGIDRLIFYGAEGTEELWCHVVRAEPAVAHALEADTTAWEITVCTGQGRVVALFVGFQMRVVPARAIQSRRLRTDWLHLLQWRPFPTQPAARTPHSWLLVGATAELAALLEEGAAPVYRLPAVPERSVMETVLRAADPHQSIGVVFWPADTTDEQSPPEAAVRLCSVLLALSQFLLDSELDVRLWVVTAGAQQVAGQAGTPEQMTVGGSLWGLARTLTLEEPRLRCTLVDLESTASRAQQVDLLAAELQAEVVGGAQIAWRGGMRYQARLERVSGTPQVTENGQPMRLQLSEYGSLDSLGYVPLVRRLPRVGELEVQVSAAGVNLRDLLNSLGLLRGYYAEQQGIYRAEEVGLGLECAGVVTAVGAGVTGFAIGDRVMGLAGAQGTLAAYALLPASTVTRIPAGLSDLEAAALPLAYL